MTYRLILRTLSADGSAELLFAQKINSFDENYPVQITIKTLVLPSHFRDGEELVAEYDVEFQSREVQSIDGRPTEDVFEYAGEVHIIYKYARDADDEPILLPAPDDVLDADVIE
jgi:hypothetical protein